MTKISKSKALELLKGSSGRFITILFTKANRKERLLNCTWVKDQKDNGLGVYIVRETKLLKSEKKDAWIKSFNVNNLKEIRVNKQSYKIV